jgi:hypothetical protein
MKINQNQLKLIIKEIIREAIAEKCDGAHIAGGKKGERMFKHIKTGYRGEKSPKKATQIAAATVNKNLGESDEKAQIPGGKLAHLNPGIVKGGKKTQFVKGRLPSPIKKANEASEEVSIEATAEIPEMPEMPEVPPFTANDEHGYDEAEEIMLIKVMKKCAEKLEAMHRNAPEAEVEPEVEPDDTTEEPLDPSLFDDLQTEPDGESEEDPNELDDQGEESEESEEESGEESEEAEGDEFERNK